jgi:hypothetical protein
MAIHSPLSAASRSWASVLVASDARPWTTLKTRAKTVPTIMATAPMR